MSAPFTDFDFSDSEEDTGVGQELTYQTARKVVIPFGKHKGKTIGDIARTKNGRSYLDYLLSWDQLREHTREAIELVMIEYKLAKGKQGNLC